MDESIIIDIPTKISCVICFEDDLEEEQVYRTDCNHVFCKACLDDWFRRGNKCCPLCRNEIDIYKHKNDNYRLVIHERADRGAIQPETLLLVRTLLAQNLRLKVFIWFSLVIFGGYFYQYYIFLMNFDDLRMNYDQCIDNNTALEDQLETLQTDYMIPGTQVSIYDGSIRIDCFYPNKYFGCHSK